VEVAVATAMECLTCHGLSQLEKAEQVCQKAEHVWAGVGCGLMDQAISVMGRKNHAMLLDCKTKASTHAPLSDDIKLVVVDSAVKHQLVDGHYEKRKGKCVEAVKAVQKYHPEVQYLRDITLVQLDEARSGMDSEAYNRASHVINECSRCLIFADHLKEGSWKKAGLIMYEGHNSLRDVYEVSCTAIDHIINIAAKQEGVYGARITGGGFGGCAVVMCEASAAERVRNAILTQYKEYFYNSLEREAGHNYGVPNAYIVSIGEGAHVYRKHPSH